ncbi:FRG domain-containing protein [Parashewanella tropica]|uniref:FRG domain-containing protein n=1 Tax=Parashewanella tropica TaxID=2547970 RepID=UPI0014781D22|nr:FRG domain-containing protein [Parashewanella tropica]
MKHLYDYELGLKLKNKNAVKTTRNAEQGNGWTLVSTGKVTVDIECDSWNGFIDLFHHEGALKENNNYVFRGQASENWSLEPTLKRAMGNIDKQVELKVLETFKKYSLGRRGQNPPQLNTDEWWALGQHFGLSTPLLDWSYSPYIAAFFAFNSNQSDTENVVVWALSKKVNEKPCIEQLKEERHIQFLSPYLDENNRLINQRGLFVKTPDMMCISEWIELIKENGTIDLARILIPKSEKKFALDSLDKMNINAFTLFPDLSGSGMYANYVNNRELTT